MNEPMTNNQKKQIDEMSYEQLLRLWRFSPSHDEPLFQGDTGEYYSSVMAEKKRDVNHVAISKRIGWEK
jgi:hypothetical protein